jgi:hypothetical protein
MSIRQVKILPEKIMVFQDKYVSIILKTGAVYLAKPIGLNDNILKVINTRETKMTLTLDQIAEIWTNEKSA